MSLNTEKVRKIVAEALYLELGEVSPGSTLMGDLGAESIDFLDIVFRLEKEFKVKIPKGEIERQARGQLNLAGSMKNTGYIGMQSGSGVAEATR